MGSAYTRLITTRDWKLVSLEQFSLEAMNLPCSEPSAHSRADPRVGCRVGGGWVGGGWVGRGWEGGWRVGETPRKAGCTSTSILSLVQGVVSVNPHSHT